MTGETLLNQFEAAGGFNWPTDHGDLEHLAEWAYNAARDAYFAATERAQARLETLERTVAEFEVWDERCEYPCLCRGCNLLRDAGEGTNG